MYVFFVFFLQYVYIVYAQFGYRYEIPVHSCTVPMYVEIVQLVGVYSVLRGTELCYRHVHCVFTWMYMLKSSYCLSYYSVWLASEVCPVVAILEHSLHTKTNKVKTSTKSCRGK